MRDISLKLQGPRVYRRTTPLGASTLLWLNACGGMSGQDTVSNGTHDAPPAGVEQDDVPAPTGPERIPQAALNAAQAVNRHYTEQLMRRRSPAGGPQ